MNERLRPWYFWNRYAKPNVYVVLKLTLRSTTAGGGCNHIKRGGRPNYSYSSRSAWKQAYRLGLGGASPSSTTPEHGKLKQPCIMVNPGI